MATSVFEEIHRKARLLEEKKKNIDREIERRLQEESEKRKKFNAQFESMQKIVEKQGE